MTDLKKTRPSAMSKLSLFLSLPVCRRSCFLLEDLGEGGVGRSPRESLVIYKLFNTLCFFCNFLNMSLTQFLKHQFNIPRFRQRSISRYEFLYFVYTGTYGSLFNLPKYRKKYRKKCKSGDLWPNMKGTAKYSASQKGALYFRRDN